MPLSDAVFIYSENTNADLNSIDGEQFGGTASKSIRLSLVDLDTDFKYVQLAVAESVNGIGEVSNVYLLELVATLGAATVDYTYSGFNQNIHTASTLAAITVPTIFVTAVEAHEQMNNMLFLANVNTFTAD